MNNCLFTRLDANVEGNFPIFQEIYGYITPGVNYAYFSLDSLLGRVFNRRAKVSFKFKLMYINEGTETFLFSTQGNVCSVKLKSIEGTTTSATLSVSNSSGTFSDIATINVGDEIELDCNFYHGKITVNNIEYSITATPTSAIFLYLNIFAPTTSKGTVTSPNVRERQIKLEECKFYSTNLTTVIANLVPAIANDKECLLDTLSNTPVYEADNKKLVVGWDE